MKSDDCIISETKTWLSRAVIGLQLCPFAKAVHLKNQIRYVVSHDMGPDALLSRMGRELRHLAQADPEIEETTLLIHPDVLGNFLDYNNFLDMADMTLKELGLEGELQIASFHPHYQFAGTDPHDIENYSNRSPFPILHLLRESSIEEAMKSFDGADAIVDRNMATLQRLGLEGWRKLWI
jgi:uncharacterized protein